MGIPTLHEIAAMPYSETIKAVRQHYDPAWGKVGEDGEPISAYRVQMDWTLSGRFDQLIEAETEEDARDTAIEWVRNDYYSGSLDIDRVVITPATKDAER